jgi:two-component system invasion response regulator UvrY
MPAERRIRVLVADDHAVVRTGIRRALQPHGDLEVIGEAAGGAEVLASPALTVAEVLLLDMNMPDCDVLGLIPECRARAPRLRVLVFTMQPEDAYAVAALRAGAVGFLGKDRPMDELIVALRRVGRGGSYVSERLAAKLLETPAVKSALPHESLSARERQIFDRIVRGAGPSEIAGELDIAPSSVATYLRRIREKVGVESTFELVQYAFRRRLVS